MIQNGCIKKNLRQNKDQNIRIQIIQRAAGPFEYLHHNLGLGGSLRDGPRIQRDFDLELILPPFNIRPGISNWARCRLLKSRLGSDSSPLLHADQLHLDQKIQRAMPGSRAKFKFSSGYFILL